MSEAAAPLFELEEEHTPLGQLLASADLSNDDEVRAVAEWFCNDLPFRAQPYARRNWGGVLHSLCSYQGKLKPALAHFLVAAFSRRGDVVLDPMSGVGTVPLEARTQGRLAIGSDMSELAVAVTRAKLEAFTRHDVAAVVDQLRRHIDQGADISVEDLVVREHADFGLNGRVHEYFEQQTLREVLLARAFFREHAQERAADAVVQTAILHVLHGNRPYALSRRSHPVTPFKPQGPAEYRPLLGHLERRLDRTLDPLLDLPAPGRALQSTYESLRLGRSVDVVITSPPFAESLRFFASNWMRLWFCGWNPGDFRAPSDDFLERRQKRDFDDAYRQFLSAMAGCLRPGGLLVLHLGETKTLDMAARIAPLLEPAFRLIYAGRECVADTESHGLTDKGATRAHGFVFCRRQ